MVLPVYFGPGGQKNQEPTYPQSKVTSYWLLNFQGNLIGKQVERSFAFDGAQIKMKGGVRIPVGI